MSEHGPPSALIMKLAEDADFSAISPEVRESMQSELIHSLRIFNNIMRLKRIFLTVFRENEWQCNHSGRKFSFTSKHDRAHVCKIEKTNNEIRVYGQPIGKIVEMVNRCENEVGIEMKYIVAADSIDSAMKYLKALNEAQFDISKVKGLNLYGKNSYDLRAMIAQAKQESAKKTEKKAPKLT